MAWRTVASTNGKLQHTKYLKAAHIPTLWHVSFLIDHCGMPDFLAT